MTKMERRLLLGVAAAVAALAVLVAIAFLQSGNAVQNATEAVQAVQQNRVDFIRRSCVASRRRNANTVKALELEIARLPLREARRARRNERYTIALIDTLAPKQDCAELAAKAQIRR